MTTGKRNEGLNLVFAGESYLGGMAGSKRIQNIINSLLKCDDTYVSNLITKKAVQNQRPEFKIKNRVNCKLVYYKLSNPFSFLRFYFSGLYFLRKSKRKDVKNIFYYYDTPSALNFPFILCARLLKFNVVVDIVEDHNLQNKKGLSLKKKVNRYLLKKAVDKMHLYADAVLTISDYLKILMKRKTKNKCPVYYLPITVDPLLFRSIPFEPRSEKTIFYGGSFGEKDGPLYLLKAFELVSKKHSTISLVLTGKPPQSGMKEVEDFIRASDVKEKMTYLGYLTDEEYYATMRGSDYFCAIRVNSSYANAGFPFKLGEMLAMGKPVITARVGDIPKFLKDQVSAMIVEPGSSKEIVAALEFLLTHPQRAAEIGKAGKEVAKSHFDSDKITEGLRNFLVHSF